MKTTIRKIALLALFLAGIYALVLFGNTFLVQTDAVAYKTMKDMKSREDIELALVGSSIVQRHLNPAILTGETGLTAFDVTITNLSPAGAIPLTRELYRTNSPKYTILAVESYTFDTVKEDIQTQMKLMPLLSSPIDRIRYWLDTADQDGQYMERALLFNTFGFERFEEFSRAMRLRMNTDKTFAEIEDGWQGEMTYSDGFLRHETMGDISRDLRETFIRVETGYDYQVFDYTKEKLLEYKALVEANGSELIVVALPALTIHALAEPAVLPYLDSAARFFEESGIPFYNFMYAKEELLPRLDHLYYDLYHMVGEGADILSAAVARVINAHIAGEDVSALFHRDSAEYLASIDFITNVWFEIRDNGDGTLMLLADSNRGTNVTPQYRYVLRHEDGTETELRGYSKRRRLDVTPDQIEGGTVRVYARVLDGEQDPALWYEIPEK